jgi:hypothetical protein
VSSAGAVLTFDTTAMGRSTCVRLPRVGAISASTSSEKVYRNCNMQRRISKLTTIIVPELELPV